MTQSWTKRIVWRGAAGSRWRRVGAPTRPCWICRARKPFAMVPWHSCNCWRQRMAVVRREPSHSVEPQSGKTAEVDLTGQKAKDVPLGAQLFSKTLKRRAYEDIVEQIER